MGGFKGLGFGIVAGLTLALGCVEPKVGQAVSPQGPPPLSVEPAEVTVSTGQGTDFKVKGQDGSRPTAAWEVQGGGTIDREGHFLAPDAPGTCMVLARASAGRTAKGLVHVVPPPRGPITAPAHVRANEQDLRASVPVQAGATYAWKVEGGTLLGDGRSAAMTFNAGTGPKVLLACRVANAAGLSKGFSLEIPLVTPVTLAVAPKSAVVTAGASRKFGFTLEGGLSGEVVWSVEPGGGTIDAAGRYQAPQVPRTYRVQVASKEDATVKDALSVRVVPAPRGPVRGPGKLKAGARGLRASVPDQEGCTYAWTVKGGRITGSGTGQAVTFEAGDGPKVKLVCEITNEAGDAFTATLNLTVAD